MEKYYTPELSEFHVGFEYEYTLLAGWRSNTFQLDSNIQALEQAINAGYIRVKHLDREDIESLGWYEEQPGVGKYRDITEAFTLYTDDETTISIFKSNDPIFLDGTIRNISELKKLMKQLNIQTT